MSFSSSDIPVMLGASELMDLLQIRQMPVTKLSGGLTARAAFMWWDYRCGAAVSFGARCPPPAICTKGISEILRASRWHIVLGAVIAIAGAVAISTSFSQYCLLNTPSFTATSRGKAQTQSMADIARIYRWLQTRRAEDVPMRLHGPGYESRGTRCSIIGDSLEKLENGYPQPAATTTGTAVQVRCQRNGGRLP